MNKREFLRTAGGAGLGLLLSPRSGRNTPRCPSNDWPRTRPSGRRSAASTGSSPTTSISRAATTACRPSRCSRPSSPRSARSTTRRRYYLRTRQVPDKAAVARQARGDGRLLAGGALHHAQHHRVARHRHQRLRLEAGRRSRRWPSRTTATCSRSSGSMRAATAMVNQGRLSCRSIRRPTTRSSSVYAKRHHAAHAADDGAAHGQHHRTHSAGAEDRGHGARAAAWT